jgi:hypothetical protein
MHQLWSDTIGRMSRRLATAKSRNATLDKTALLSEHGDTLRAAFGPLCSLSGKGDADEPGKIAERICEFIASGKDAESTASEITKQVCDV